MAKEEKKKKEDEEEGKTPEEGEKKEGGEGEAPAEGAEGGEEGGKKKGKKKKLILIIVAVVVVIAIAVPAVLYLTGHLKKKTAVEGEIAADGSVAGEGGEGGKGAHQSVFYDMEEFIVNLNVGSKRPSFLKMTVSLEVANELQIPTIEKNMPRVRDNFQVYLRELRQEDLQGSAGLYRLREELLLRVNKVVYPAKVNDILFKEILVQ